MKFCLESRAKSELSRKIEIINEVARPGFWKDVTLERLEKVRVEMRDLVQFIKDDKKRTFTINIPDLIEYEDAPKHALPSLTSLTTSPNIGIILRWRKSVICGS